MFKFKKFSRLSLFYYITLFSNDLFIIYNVRINDFFINKSLENLSFFNNDFVFFKFFTSHNTTTFI